MRDLAKRVGDLLRERKLTLSLAESCTGGLIASQITDIPGSSEYFLGGVVSYSNSAKERILGVPRKVLEEAGAVSEETALAMAKGARELLGSHVALAVTGIAGPTGGTETKPVGLTFVALDAEGFQACQRHLWRGTRLENKGRSARAALELLERYLARS